ncbi:MAG TPA: Fur family transcriptional regulator [Flavobacterium sp.]|jgi:Fur family ferric uptake transcriptional regulator
MKTSRNTNAKAIILDIITNSDVALSHAELQALANGACDRVTIYRILDRLVNEDLIHKAVDLDGTVKYARCHHTEQNHLHNHVHFSCEKCHLVTCLDTIEPTFTLPKEYLIKEMNFILSGLCPNCK